jgi:glutamate/tyrosine decarboxylase-like PLP-dependent enzyme
MHMRPQMAQSDPGDFQHNIYHAFSTAAFLQSFHETKTQDQGEQPEIIKHIQREMEAARAENTGYATFLRELLITTHVQHTLIMNTDNNPPPAELLSEIVSKCLLTVSQSHEQAALSKKCMNFIIENRTALEEYLSKRKPIGSFVDQFINTLVDEICTKPS